MDTKYDAIIIGAGIGGLVCGCYLAKAGMKVLIVEKNDKPGGYCTSFTRDGFTFDTGVHSLDGCGERGKLRKIINDFNLSPHLTIIRINPSDIIITPEHKLRIKNDINETIQEFQINFPHQAQEISKFINYVTKTNFVSLFSKLRNKVFREVLDEYIKDNKLKEIFCILLRSLGIPSTKIAAINVALFLKEYLLDGGYYPLGGMGAFSYALEKSFKSYGGDILYLSKVKKIKTRNNKVEGVIIDKAHYIRSKYVVSNCDATQTFFELLGKEHLEKKFAGRLEKMVPNMSAFIVFIGIKKSLKDILEKCCSLWYFSDYNIDLDLSEIFSGSSSAISNNGIMICFPSLIDAKLAPPGKESVFIITNASFQNERFWEMHKYGFSEIVIKRAEKIIPGLSEMIQIREMATPHTLYKHTLNKTGSIHGWAALLDQIDRKIISEKSIIDGLFLVGHWTTQPGQGGIPMVIQSGSNVAKLVFREYSKNKTVVTEISK